MKVRSSEKDMHEVQIVKRAGVVRVGMRKPQAQAEAGIVPPLRKCATGGAETKEE